MHLKHYISIETFLEVLFLLQIIRIIHDPSRANINLALPRHNSEDEIADHDFNINTGKLNKRMKSLNPATP